MASYNWTGPNSFNSTSQNATIPDATTAMAGTYTLIVTNSNGCTDSDSVEVTVVPSPDADFYASDRTPCVNEAVNFTNNSTGTYTSWNWTFGDGGNSTVQNPSHTYTKAGTYNVSLTISNGCGNNTETKPNYITVLALPDADFYASDLNPCANVAINFSDNSTGTYDTWAWDFGDNSTSGLQNPSHTYTKAGTYNVSLTISNGCGNDTETKNNYITVLALPEADFIGSPPSGCAPLTVDFTDLSTGNITSRSWTFGDGGTSADKNPSHAYTIPGTYTVSLTVSNDCGNNTETKTGYITAQDCAPEPRRGGGGGCPAINELTCDWDGHNTTEELRGNDRLAVDLLGPSPDGSHSLLLEQGTHAPTVGEKTYYLIVIRELEETPPLPENTVAIVAFNVTPEDAIFDRDIFLTLGVVGQLPENALNGTLTMAYYDDVGGVWVPMDSEPGEPPNSVAELSLSAPLNHFTIYAVLVEVAPTPPPPPAHFVASGLSIETSEEKIWETVTFVTKTGESVAIAANVANDGGQEGTYTVELKLDGETVDTEIVTLGAGQSQQVSFILSGLDYGQHEVEVDGLSREFTTSRTITWWLIIVIIVAIGLIIWGVVWGRRRRRAAQEG